MKTFPTHTNRYSALFISALFLFALLIAACGTAATATPAASTQPATAVPEPTATTPPPTEAASSTPPPEAVTPEEVTLEGAEGLAIYGTFYPPLGEQPAPGVLLLHMLGSDRRSWDDFAAELARNGYAALSLDMRGHGETGDTRNWEKAAVDLQIAMETLVSRSEVDPERTGIVGASIGANLALRTAATLPAARAAVLLSPGLDYLGVTTGDAIEPYGERPLLIVAAEGDTYSSESSQELDGMALGEHSLVMYTGAGHGTGLLYEQPDLVPAILAFLDQYVRPEVPCELKAEGCTVEFFAADGVRLRGRAYGLEGPVIVLANMGESTFQEWEPLIPYLRDAGFRVLGFDWRGLGESEGLHDAAMAAGDLAAAVAFAREQGAEQVGVIGADLGAAAAVLLVAREPVDVLVLLSLPAEIDGLTVGEENIAALGEVPSAFFNSRQDPFAEQTRLLFEMTPGHKEIRMYPGAAHGTEILNTENGADLAQNIVRFLKQGLGMP